MKKLLCLILSAALLILTGCGAAEPPAAEAPAETASPAVTAAPEVSPSPAEAPDALPESCMPAGSTRTAATYSFPTAFFSPARSPVYRTPCFAAARRSWTM